MEETWPRSRSPSEAILSLGFLLLSILVEELASCLYSLSLVGLQ